MPLFAVIIPVGGGTRLADGRGLPLGFQKGIPLLITET